MMTVVLPNHRLGAELPQPGIMIRTSSDQVGAIGAESTIPHPSLMRLERSLQRQGSWGSILGHILLSFDVVRSIRINSPYSGVVVCGAGRQMAYVRTQKNSSQVGVVRLERGDWDK